MARTVRIPDPLARRHLLERELEPARALAIAEAYLAQSRSVDAVPFLSKAGEADRLAQIAEEALRDGNAFLFGLVARELHAPPSAERWRALAARAREAGLLEYAESAERHAGAAETTGVGQTTDATASMAGGEE